MQPASMNRCAPRPSLRVRRACGAVCTLLACAGEPPPRPDPIVRPPPARSPGERADRWTFADGARIEAVVFDPEPVAPGAALGVSVRTAAADAGRFELALVEPADAAWQVVAYGPQGYRRLRPEEDEPPGVRWEVAAQPGPTVLRVPEDYAPSSAVVLARRRVGPALVAAVSGPRREDGVAVLGVAAVAARPRRIRARRLARAPVLDGTLAPGEWPDPSVALVESRTGRRGTAPAARVFVGWTPEALFVAAQIDDPDVWGTFTERDARLWTQEAFEVFVGAPAPSRRYVELQVSPRCVVFDAAFEAHREGGPEADLDTTPACRVRGTLDRRGDRDEGWTVEWALPMAQLCAFTDLSCEASAGLVVAMNAFVLDRPRRGPATALALSPTRVPDFHAMEAAARVELVP